MSTSLIQSFGNIRLGGGITTTSGNSRIVVGGNLGMIISDSGNLVSFITGVSGFLQNEIAMNSAGVTSLNSLSGSINIVGTGLISVVTGAGGKIFISGQTDPVVYGSLQLISGELSQVSGSLNSLSGFVGIQSGFSAATYATINNLAATGTTLYNLIIGFSGQFLGESGSFQTQINTLTTNLTATGATLWNIVTGISGSYANFSMFIPTGSGALWIPYPFNFPTNPFIQSTFGVYTGNQFGYGIWVQGITVSGYTAAFSDIILESGNYVVSYASIR